MNVRSFRLSDYVAVNGLLEQVLSEVCYQETKDALAKQLSWDSDLVLIAVEEEQVVGVIIGTIDNNKGYYYRIAVHAEHRRKGIGKALIHSLKQRFEQRKVSRILITVDEHNEPILPVYESAGWFERDFARMAERRLSIMA
ncbi:GNAT family N-acetyltransferase [Paenibacillus aurantius]|uniref:GNAT family N-acetyltransferase n=1 Tax=Paenibacillus aurantius TaxID=2918900 RepID=A0AA96RIE4_9BACL|nr:GNAT family N-acetyltransferase [Paenibacillus aurantius]WJH36749.1 GNAT family N-acetyltransferase [Paenibacillus sp. CC-CFT747]WNQ12104.1 GNAT family N-acetyltransferase [Paenibacillus aurantius]